MATILLYGDTVRHPAMRHEVPLQIIDPFLFVEREGQAFVLTNQREHERIAEFLPAADVHLVDDFGVHDLVADGMARYDAQLEMPVRALADWGVDAALVSPELPVAVADRVRAAGVELTVDRLTLDGRRRVKSDAERLGMRRTQRAAEAGMAAAERLIRSAEPAGGRLRHDGREPTAEAVRDAIRAACAVRGAPAPPEIMVASALSGGGHDPGSGPLPADLPIAAAEIVEDGGFRTQRTRERGERLTTGFWFALGHGIGLDIHEAPRLGLGGDETLVPGDVLAVEPGIERLEGIGGVRFEDLPLITADGCETLTRHPYDL